MDNILIAILTLIVGILLGGVIILIVFTIRASRSVSKANKLIEAAKL